MIANEVHGDEPFPGEVREFVVQELVENPGLGWPDYDAADDYVSQFDWKED